MEKLKIPKCVSETATKTAEILKILNGLSVSFAKHILNNVNRKIEEGTIINSQHQ